MPEKIVRAWISRGSHGLALPMGLSKPFRLSRLHALHVLHGSTNVSMMSGAGLRAPREAFLLTAVGGSIDAVGVLSLGGLFVAHMSGNSAAFGAAFGQGNWHGGWPHLAAIPIFVLGLFLGYLWILPSRTYRRCAGLLAVEAGLLLAFILAVHLEFGFFAAIPALLAMGLQNASLRELRRSSFPTTYITGVLDTFGKSCAIAALERKPEAMADAWRAGAIWLSYATGAVLGSALLGLIGIEVVILPIAILVTLAIQFARIRDDLAAIPTDK